MDQLAEEDSGQAPSASFTLHIHFRGQRFKSRPVPCACEPSFEEGFLLELHKEGAGNSDNTVVFLKGNSVLNIPSK